jgi:hypothetical protein
MPLVTPAADPIPAGWYRDPLGLPQLRWWNGMTWTNNIQEQRPELHTWQADGAAAGHGRHVA